MIFRDQVTINTFLKQGGDQSLLTTETMASGLLAEDLGEYRSIKKERLTYLGKNLLIDEFGTVKDESDYSVLTPSLVKINSSKCLAIMFKNSKNQKVYKRVIHLVAMAFLKSKCPKRVKLLVENINLNTLSNVKTIDYRKPKQLAVTETVKKVMPITSVPMMRDHCRSHDINSVDDLLNFHNLSQDEINLVNPSAIDVIKADFNDQIGYEDGIEFNYHGVHLMISPSGCLARKVSNKWSEYTTKTMIGRVLSVVIYCEDTKSRSLSIPNTIAKVFGGLDSRRKIKYIDGNPYNTHISNLWWTGCGRRFEF